MYSTVPPNNQAQLREFLFDLRDKLLRVFGRYNTKLDVPLSISRGITPVLNNSFDSDTDSDGDTNPEVKMTELSVTEFLNFATMVLPEFDGKPENLQWFIDGIDRMNTQIATHVQVAISLIKTKLAGNTRSIITNKNTIVAIKATLKN